MSVFYKVNENAINEMTGNGEVSILTEAYFGKSKELTEIEKELDKIVKIVRSVYTSKTDVAGYHQMLQKVIISPEVKIILSKIEKLFCKQFGFYEFNLLFPKNWTWMGTNAFTCTAGVIRRVIAHDGMLNLVPLKQSSGGYYDKSHTFACSVFIVPDLFAVESITGGEILGVLLHEIGHNFQCTPLANIGWFFPMLDFLDLNLGAAESIPGVKKATMINKIINYILDNELVAEWQAFKSRLWNIIYEFASTVFKPLVAFFDMWEKVGLIIQQGAVQMIPFLHALLMGKATLVKLRKMNPIELAYSLCGYSGEVFADSFAAAYGYGPELTSANAKLHNSLTVDYNFLLDSPIAPLYEISIITFEIMFDVFNLDPHPSNQRRILNLIEKLEHDIESGELPPSLKKSALKDLKKQREVYQKYLKAEVGDKQLALLASYRVFNDSMFGGKLDIKHTLNKVLNAGQYEA